ncbi:ATP-binding protein [Sphingomonas sp.]|uniref:sensor histidine kinase NtrY-like n=1 Tax=Sphingomonas sp. TaxID=28214 RepID=UPI0025D6DE34|nr:ATP-binding protein [Sphingomonas sp.]MBV9529297.1 HAMP domain-containing protein [Sphingomonas sp.]
MDAQTTESPVTSKAANWLERERASGRFYDRVSALLALLLVAMVGLSVWLLRRSADPGTLASPPVIALLLVAILLPAIVLMALYARKIAIQRAERGGLGSGQLHVRLVALFTAIAAVPTVLVAIFASLLFQSGIEFWFSNRARNMLESTVQVAHSTYAYELGQVGSQAAAMSKDLGLFLQKAPLDDPNVQLALGYQTFQRSLNEAAILHVSGTGQLQTFAVINGYQGMIDERRLATVIAQLKAKPAGVAVDAGTPNRISVLTRLSYGENTYLYVGRWVDPEIARQIKKANDVLKDYRGLLVKSRTNQLRFNAALLLGALIIVGLAILTALRLADRMVRPVGELVGAAGRIEAGDFSARVPVGKTEDEVQTLALAFNRMTGRLEEQTSDLRAVNTQLDTRRAFIEAVLGSVTAGIVALDAQNRILLINRSAEGLLHKSQEQLEGKELSSLSPELAEFMLGDKSNADVILVADSGQRTLAINRVRYSDGAVLTFDDITDQLTDQRRAAWSDIARRIAHEIRNPLTPIQLAAERLQRRFGKDIAADKETFDRLTDTIVRQVGDLRRMVDEFSNFARMPKPVFHEADIHEIARQAVFLHEVAHPAITFRLDPAQGEFPLVCDRRQLSQALTNIVKNAVEAIESRRSRGEHSLAGDRVDVRLRREGRNLVVDVLDTGIGLPEDRERITEPYVTTRVRGTGLGLAIVKKIVEEHMGEIAFLDRSGGGTHVRISLDADKLATLATAEPPADEQSHEEDNGEGRA